MTGGVLEIHFENDGMKKSVGWRMNTEKAATFEWLLSLTEKAQYAYSETNRDANERTSVPLFHYYVADAVMDGTHIPVKIQVRDIISGTGSQEAHYYTHNLQKNEVISGPSAGVSSNIAGNADITSDNSIPNSGRIVNDGQAISNVEMLSNILAGNGIPQTSGGNAQPGISMTQGAMAPGLQPTSNVELLSSMATRKLLDQRAHEFADKMTAQRQSVGDDIHTGINGTQDVISQNGRPMSNVDMLAEILARDAEQTQQRDVRKSPEKGWQAASSDDFEAANKSNDTTPVEIGAIDFSDEQAVFQRLSEAETELAGLDHEVNYTVTADGKVWQVNGTEVFVRTGDIPSDLKGSYSYHNHPAEKTNYSFSAADVGFFFESGQACSKASDDVYTYTMRRTPETIEKTYDEVYHRFREIYKSHALKLSHAEVIDIDQDGYHETMKILSQELNFYYERKSKNQ